MAVFGGNRQEAIGAAPYATGETGAGSAASFDEVEFRGVDLLGNELVAIDQFGRPWKVDNENPDPNTFKLVNLIHTGGDQYFAVANNGQNFPISHELFGRLSREDKRVDVSSHTDDGFHIRRTSPTGGSIEITSKVAWKVENEEDYDDAVVAALAHTVSQGEAAKQRLAVFNPQSLAEQRQYEAEMAQAAELQRQQEAEERRRRYEESLRTGAQVVTTAAAFPTLQDKLMRDGTAEDEAAAAAPDEASDTDPSHESRTRRAKKHGVMKSRRARRFLHYVVAGVAGIGIAVPATHTVVHEVGTHTPLVKFDTNDPMAATGDFGHNIVLPYKGLKEAVTIITGGKVKQ